MFGGALLAPAIMSPSGADQRVRIFAQHDLGGRYDAEGASVAAPYGLGAAALVGYGVSMLTRDCAGSALSSRALSAMGVSLAAVTALKLVVGRSYLAGHTPPGGDRTDVDRSTTFTPFSSGLGAWPSGHAAVTFAFAAVVRTQLGSRPFAQRYLGYALAGAVSFAMAYGDHHWASDLLSGALVGEAVGRSFGAPAAPSAPFSVTLAPFGSGFSVVGAF
jgi:membrane-associated phospholipid phosphatase